MAALADGDAVEVAGSGSARYTLSRQGGVYACTCPAWRNQGRAIDGRTCKHLRASYSRHLRVRSVAGRAAVARADKLPARALRAQTVRSLARELGSAPSERRERGDAR